MKAPKSRTKLLRVPCGMCKATQDSLSSHCSACRNPLYTNMQPEELEVLRQHVATLETNLDFLERGERPKNSPYAPYDAAKAATQALQAASYIPGMKDYLAATRRVMLPSKVAILYSTLKANIIFAFVLLAFALIPALLGWPAMVTGLMLLPALVWLGIIYKTYVGLQRARAELEAQS
jgi:hypothetical protein